MATWNRDDSDLVIGTGIGSTTIGSNLTISNNEIDCASGDLLLDAASDLILDADSSNILLKDNGVLFGSLNNNSSELTIKSGSTSAINLSGANTTLLGSLSIQPVSGDGSNESFLVVDTGDNIVKKRTGAQVRSDLGISDNEIIDWTTNQGSTDIHQGNIPWANGATFDNDNQGLVPNPGSTGTTTRYLREDGYFQVPPDTNTQLSTEQVQDIVGNMFSSNSETRINVTYDDTGGKIDLLVDDFLKTDTDDSTSGTITAGGFTTTGTWTFDDATSGTVGITTVHTGSSFTNNDTSLMTAGAIKEKIESYGYTTTDGDITSVRFVTDSGSPAAAEDTADTANFSLLGSSGVGITNSGTIITAAAVPAEIDHDSLNNWSANKHIDWTSASAGTIHDTNYTNTNQLTTFIISDGTTDQTIAHGNTLTFTKGEGIDIAVSATDTVTISAEDATGLNKGIASFSASNFVVSGGNVNIKDQGVDLAELVHIATDSFLGRTTSSTGAVEVLSQSDALTILGVEAGATADQTQADINGLAITEVGTITSGVWNGTAIAHAYIGNDAIEGDNLADNAVDSEHYTDGSIDHVHLSADAVDGDNIADDSINSEHYVDGSIDTAHIADDQVTYAKIQDVSATDRILGRDSAGAGVIEEITPGNLKTMLSLNNVENTALSTFAGTSNITTLASNLSLGGSPTTTTQSAGDNSTKIATTAYVETAVSNLVDSAPDALNTLNELATALGNDANFSTTVTNSIATKAPLASPTFTGTVTMPATIASAGDLTLDVAGDITLDADGGDITIVDNSPSSFKPSFQITSTDAGSFGPIVTYKHNSASPVNTDQIFTKSIIGKNDAGQDVTYINDSAVLLDVADGEERAYCQKALMTHGTLRNAIKFAAQSDSTVDTDIGYGAASSTTIAGDLTITGGNITNAITFDSGITDAGTIAAGTWQGTAINQTYLVGQSGTNTGDQTKASFDLDHLYTLVGAASDDAENLSTFTGSTIADDQTIKQALQALETAVELRLTNNADDTMAGTLTIDKNNSTASNGTTKGLFVDVDRTGNVSSGIDYVYGLDLDVDVSGSSNHFQLIYGMELTVTADDMGSGTSSAIGLNLKAEGADTNAGIVVNTADGGTDYKQVSSADPDDYFSMVTTTNGATTLATVDDSGAAAAHLTLDPTGDLIISGAHVKIDAGKILYLDGGADTFIHEASDGVLDITAGGHRMVRMTGAITGNNANFGTTGVGFVQFEPTYNASDTNVNFNDYGNKAFVTFGSGNIADMNLYFPDVSCNCTLLLKQDGVGSRLVNAWKTFDQADGNESTVVWAGGSAPTLTTTENKLDIISFYWDNDNHKAYGVASLNF
jgi:hypothetical protein